MFKSRKFWVSVLALAVIAGVALTAAQRVHAQKAKAAAAAAQPIKTPFAAIASGKADVEAFLDAFDIDDGHIRKLMIGVALSPHNGGLREVKQILEAANMLAIADDTAIALGHVEDAMGSRLTQHMRRAA